jgi:hypothetical protein
LKFRLDFGRVFPGLLLVISGLILLVVLLIVAAVAFLFSFAAGTGAILGTALELTLIPAILIAAGIVTILTGFSWRNRGGEGWFSETAKDRAHQDRIRFSGRVGEVVGVVISFIIFLFLYENQLRGVAFFASGFGGLEEFFFYAPLFTGIALSLARAVYGRRNGIRPLDSLNALFLAVAAFWLLSVFPFDFSHLGDMFPTTIRFLLFWLNNDVGRFLFNLAGIASVINFVYLVVLYSLVRSQLLGMSGSNKYPTAKRNSGS